VITHTIRHTVGLLWTSDQPVAETSTYTRHKTYKHKRQTSMPRAGFEPAIPATKRPQAHALEKINIPLGKLRRRSSTMPLQSLKGPWPPHKLRFLNRIWTLGKNPLDEWSARRKGLYLHRKTAHRNTKTNIHALSRIRTYDISVQAMKATPQTALHWDRLVVYRKIILKWMLKIKEYVWVRFIWLKTGISTGLL
jgi:hypothetical protein